LDIQTIHEKVDSIQDSVSLHQETVHRAVMISRADGLRKTSGALRGEVLGSEQAHMEIHGEAKKSDADPRMMLFQHNLRRTLSQFSKTYGDTEMSSSRLPTAFTTRPNVGISVAIESKRNRRKARILFALGFHFLYQRVLLFEVQVQQSIRHWIHMPSLAASIRVFNIRPSNTPIFAACRDLDIFRVRNLLQSGEATVHDVDDDIGGLLEVRHSRVLQRLPNLLRSSPALT